MINDDEAKAPEPRDILNAVENLSRNNSEIREDLQEVINEFPKKQSYRDKMLEWLNKVKQTLSASNIKKSLSTAGRKIVDGILKAVNYLIKIFKKERTEAQDLDKPKKTVRWADEQAATKIPRAFRASKDKGAVGKHSAAVLKQERQNTVAPPAPKKAIDLSYRKTQRRKTPGAPRRSVSKGTGRGIG